MTQTATDIRELQNYIGGGWRTADASTFLDVHNPATGETLCRVPLSAASDVDAAAKAAKAAQRDWAQVSVIDRARAIFALREILVRERGDLARLLTLDMGKTLADADMEVGRGIESVEAASAAPHLLKGEMLEGVARQVDVQMVRQPIGVVGAITPFNFPAMIPLWFLPFALVSGNGFVLKPSEQVPLVSERIIQLVEETGAFPKGLVNLVHGAHDAVNAVLDHPDIDAISFVGSAKIARYVSTRASENGKRVQALGGAKNALVIMPDAEPNLTAKAVMGSAFGAAGQRCLAGSIAILVGTDEEQARSRDLLISAAKQLKVGDGMDPSTDVAPLVSVQARERVELELEEALKAGGGEVVLDGRRNGGDGGAELGPTIVDNVPEDGHLTQEELFGPVLALVRVPTLDAALEFANRSRYGNAAVLFTQSGGAARQFRREMQAGMLGINVGVAAPVAWFPFSGWKDSFEGTLHANGRDAFNFYTQAKVITSRWA